MKKLRNKNPGFFLCCVCYAGGLAVLLAVHIVGFAGNVVARGSGEISPAELTLDDFDMEQMEQRDGKLVTLGGDPQLLLKDTARRVDSVLFECSYAKPPLGLSVYWGRQGQGYSVRRMQQMQEGVGVAWLPALGGEGLRIDPGVAAGNVITVKRVAINQPRAWYSFFIPSAGEWALFALLPGLVACGLWNFHQFKDMLWAQKAVRPL